MMGMTDFQNIETDKSSSNYMQPIPQGSWRNTAIDSTEMIFGIIFAVECALKVIGMGFVMEPGSYLRDPWNCLDFAVVVTSAIDLIAGAGAGLSGLRTLRILRPLKSVNKVPGLQVLVISLLRSMSKLMSVIMLLCFIFAVFGVLGVQLFSGRLNARCRLTPYPVTLDWRPWLDYADYKCIDHPNPEDLNFMLTIDRPAWTKDSSVWAQPRKCYWPLDEEDTRVCTPESGSGVYQCYHGQELSNRERQALNSAGVSNTSDWRWCGSNFDALGNLRFKSAEFYSPSFDNELKYLDRQDIAEWDTYIEDINWGYTKFDNFGYAVDHL